MNITNIEHAIFAVLIQTPFIAIGSPWYGALIAIAFFLAREHAQYERKLVKGGDVNSLSPFAGFGFLVHGSTDAKLDFYLPAIAVCIVALSYTIIGYI